MKRSHVHLSPASSASCVCCSRASLSVKLLPRGSWPETTRCAAITVPQKLATCEGKRQSVLQGGGAGGQRYGCSCSGLWKTRRKSHAPGIPHLLRLLNPTPCALPCIALHCLLPEALQQGTQTCLHTAGHSRTSRLSLSASDSPCGAELLALEAPLVACTSTCAVAAAAAAIVRFISLLLDNVRAASAGTAAWGPGDHKPRGAGKLQARHLDCALLTL